MSGVNGYFLVISLARVQYVIPDRHRLCVVELRQLSDLLGIFDRRYNGGFLRNDGCCLRNTQRHIPEEYRQP